MTEGEQMTLRFRVSCLAGAVWLAACAAESTGVDEREARVVDQGLQCEMSLSGSRVSIALRNGGDQAVDLYGPGTPWDQYSDAFLVQAADSREALSYVGPRVERLADPTAGYLSITPGEILRAEYELNGAYLIEHGAQYSVQVRSPFLVRMHGLLERHPANCGSISMMSDSQDRAGRVAQALSVHPDCSPSQQQRIGRAIDGALAASRSALADLGNTHSLSRWFGPDVEVVRPALAFVRMADDPDEYVRCGGDPCEDNYLGVVVDYYFDEKVYLCGSVWSQPFVSMTSFSQVETLVHELAHHVDQLRSITDWEHPGCTTPQFGDNTCYGYPNALRLATHCSDCAMANAVNYAGFAIEAYMRPAIVAATL